MTLTDQDLERYARHIVLKEIGGPGQKKLLQSKVLVIGAGGLGAPLILYLAAAGVGTIGIVDDDEVTLSNLQRQVIHKTGNVGKAKTESAQDAAGEVNPGVKITPHQLRVNADNARDLLKDYDIIADGCDNFATRLLVSDACVALKKTLVSAALMRFEGQLSTFKPHAGKDLPCYRCLVPVTPPMEGLSCAEVGILGATAGVMGTLQATEVIKEILGIGESLAGKLMLYNALDASFKTIKLPKDPACSCAGS